MQIIHLLEVLVMAQTIDISVMEMLVLSAYNIQHAIVITLCRLLPLISAELKKLQLL